MTALTAPRNTQERTGDIRVGLLGASQTIFSGALLMRNATGHIIKGGTATGSIGVGRAEADVTSTTAGETQVRYKPGIFRFVNSTSTDAITIAEIGDACFIVDDQTVAKTNGGGTRSAAGVVEDVDTLGVWVRFDEALTIAALS